MQETACKKLKIKCKLGRLTPVVVLLILAVFCSVLCAFVGRTISYYSSSSNLVNTSARVANWVVDVSITDTPVAMKTNGGWSTPYKVDIINNSEVMASYGHDADGDFDANYSYLTFSNLPIPVNRVRIFDPKTGDIADLSTSLQNHSVVVRFAGVLNPGEAKTYYIQFGSNTTQESVVNEYENVVVVNAQFYFEQTFREYQTLASGYTTPNTGSFSVGSSSVATQLNQNGVNSNGVDTSKISGVNSNGVDTSKISGVNSNAVDTSKISGVNSNGVDTSKILGVNSNGVDTSKVTGVDSDAVDRTKMSGVKSDAVDTSKMDAVKSNSVSQSFINKK